MKPTPVDFEIAADQKLSRHPELISIHSVDREKIGVAVGQRIHFNTEEGPLFLQVISGEKPGPAKVAPTVFQTLLKKPVEYTIPPITLGCDPEFFLVYRNSLISAASYLLHASQVGCDGSLGELRPTYGTHESQVTANLHKLITSIPKHLQDRNGAPRLIIKSDIRFEAHSYFKGLAAGFHVHLGLPPEILHSKPETHLRCLKHLVRCLDWYVSTLLVNLEPDTNRRCGRSNYGLPGNYRTSNITLEYRTPGAFYLRSPVLSEGLLATSLLVTETFIDRLRDVSRDFTRLAKLSESDLHEILPVPRPELVKYTLMDPEKRMAIRATPRILDKLRGLPNYIKHQNGIDKFSKEVEKGNPPSPNLKDNWRN